MSKSALSFAAVVIAVLCSVSPMSAQVAPMGRPAVRPRVVPCWQQVGISQAAMQERAAISRETKAQVEAVCANSSLTPQQRQQQIRQIREEAKQRQEALISPAQQEELRACQQQRAALHPPGPGVHPSGGVARGPCGELAAAPHPNPPAGGHPANEKPPGEEDTTPQ